MTESVKYLVITAKIKIKFYETNMFIPKVIKRWEVSTYLFSTLMD